MIDDAKSMLKERDGVEMHEKFLSVGFSSSAVFATRFSFLHYDRVLATIAGGIGGLVPVPEKEIDGVLLNYPLGTNDYQSITGKDFDLAAHNSVERLYFNGNEDSSCPFHFEGEDLSDEEARAVHRIWADSGAGFGNEPINIETMQQLWASTLSILHQNEIALQDVTLPGVGHDFPPEALAIVDAFLISKVVDGAALFGMRSSAWGIDREDK